MEINIKMEKEFFRISPSKYTMLRATKQEVYDFKFTNELLRGNFENLQIPFPTQLEFSTGRSINNFGSASYSGLLISDRVKSIFEENQLTGWKTYPVEIFRKNGDKLEGIYHGLSITGRSGSIIWNSQTMIKKRCPTCPEYKVYVGMNPGLSEWDGSDFFYPENTFTPIISEKVKYVLEKNKIKGFTAINVKELESGGYVTKVL